MDSDPQSAEPASGPEGNRVDGSYLDALGRAKVVVGRRLTDTSLLLERDGRRALVVCSSREVLVRHYERTEGEVAAPLGVRTLEVAQMAAIWAAPDVDLVVDPGTPHETWVPVQRLREHLGMTPVTAGDLDPLPFLAFTGGKRSTIVGVAVMVLALLLGFQGLAQGQPPTVLLGLLGIVAGGYVGRRGFRQVRDAYRTKRRMASAHPR